MAQQRQEVVSDTGSARVLRPTGQRDLSWVVMMRAAGGNRGADGGSAARMGRMTIDGLLATARGGFCWLRPVQALDAMRSGAALIDIRSNSQIARDGTIPGGS